MTDTIESLRQQLAALHAEIESWHNGYQETGRSLGWPVPESHLAALRELREESNSVLGAEVERLTTAPSEAEIEAWKIRVSLDWAPQWPTVSRDHLVEAVALMRRGSQAAPSDNPEETNQ